MFASKGGIVRAICRRTYQALRQSRSPSFNEVDSSPTRFRVTQSNNFQNLFPNASALAIGKIRCMSVDPSLTQIMFSSGA